MKSINKFLVVMLCFVLFTTMAFALSACTEKELKIAKIEVSGPSETAVGEFDYNDYTVKLIFDDGSTKDIKLNEDLLSASDRELLDTPGTHTITVKYNDVTCTFTVTIKGDGESQDKGIKSIAISGPNEIVAGNIDYNDFSLVITYEDDSTTTIELREEFILEEDRAKLNTVGSHSISITYNGTTTTWNITVKENESTGDNIFEGVTFEDATYTYDGREKSIEVKGVPDGATVKYNVSNNYTNAGVYPIEATISKEGYKTLVLTATLTIDKATYDMSSVEFADKSVVYNGEVQKIEISGNLPQGVTVTYENNDKTDVGTYEVVAKFTGDSNNYEPIADMTATLTIEDVKGTEGLIYEKINNNTEYSVVGYEGSESDVFILATHKGLPVTSIGWNAFSGCSGLTSITIPDSVTSIGSSVFYDCSGLTSITVAEGNSKYHSQDNCIIETASKTLIAGCKTSIIPDDGSVTSIGDGAFRSCGGLTSITIPDSVTSIGNWAFEYCSGLTSVTIGNGVTSIGYSAFEGCSGLTSITIPDSVTSIGQYAFDDCTNLTSITIPFVGAKLDGTGDTNFDYIFGMVPISLREVIITGGTSIGNWAFEYCSGLTSITIPDSVTSIGDFAFSGCSGLTSITIPSSVTSIGNYTFYNCSGLTSITIPESVTSIGGWAFAYCSGLTDVYYTGDIAGWCNIQFVDITSNPMYYADNLYIKGELVTDLVIPDNVTSIGNQAFYNCSGLTSITIPDSVTSIGNSAFSGCSGLTSITIPSSVTSIGSDAFYDCTSLISITIPFVGSNADGTGATNFEYIFGSPVGLHGYAPESLREVIITGGTSIGYRAFA